MLKIGCHVSSSGGYVSMLNDTKYIGGNVDPNAEFISEMTYKDVIAKELKVMDLTAVSLWMHSGIEIVVFDMKETENFRKVVTGEKVGTKIVKGE